jgi:hypothetical protein
MDEHLRKVDQCGKLKSFQLILTFHMEHNQARILKASVGCSLGPLKLVALKGLFQAICKYC